MRINHNISALRASNQLLRTNSALDKSIEKLTSGYRINRAADDAAGLAISQKMKTQIRGLDQASRNASDGISLIQTAEGALSEVESMLQRMRELSVQAANGTNTDEDREAIQNEIDQLNEEIDRISDTTEFNTKTLLNGNVDRKSYSDNSNVKLISLTDAVQSKAYQVTVTKEATKATLEGNAINGLNNGCMTESGKFCINGQEVEINEGESIQSVYQKLRKLGDSINVDVSYDTTGDIGAGSKITIQAQDFGSKYDVEIYSDNSALLDQLGLSGATETEGTDAEVTLLKNDTKVETFTNTTTYAADGNKITITDKDGFEMTLEVQEGIMTPPDPTDPTSTANTDAIITVLEQGPVVLQIGANEGQTIKVSIPEVSSTTLGIDTVNISTEDGAQAAITALDEAINNVSAIRAKLGAYQNRLDHAIANLDTTSENMSEALSRIEDVDMAEEMSTYTQKNVLAQAGTSMLAQANERPQTVLSLLQG